MKKRYGILTGGGDCPGLNAVLRGAGKSLLTNGHELVGFEDGFQGLMMDRHRELTFQDLSGILTLGGTILGTSNRDNPFCWASPDAQAKGAEGTDCSDRVGKVMESLKLDALIVAGGDGSLSIADRLGKEKNIPCIGVPKTIDNDLLATDVTFGFDTAVQTATECIDRLSSTAMSHHRAMVVELMGRYAGWLTLHAGVAGGADIILLPEFPYSVERVLEVIQERSRKGKRFSIVAVAEGAKPAGGELTIQKIVKGSYDPVRLGGVAASLAETIEQQTGLEARSTVLGYIQRGGSPTSLDRLLGTGFGHLAALMAMEGKWGGMAAYRDGKFAEARISDAVCRLKLVTENNQCVAAARAVGTSFGVSGRS